MIDISFSLTTSENIRCGKCYNNLKGKEGFLYIKLPITKYKEKRIKLCMDCIQEIMQSKKYKHRKSLYTNLVKKTILKKLR